MSLFLLQAHALHGEPVFVFYDSMSRVILLVVIGRRPILLNLSMRAMFCTTLFRVRLVCPTCMSRVIVVTLGTNVLTRFAPMPKLMPHWLMLYLCVFRWLGSSPCRCTSVPVIVCWLEVFLLGPMIFVTSKSRLVFPPV